MLELLAPLLIHPSFRLWRLGKQSLLCVCVCVCVCVSHTWLCSCCSEAVCQAEEFAGSPEALSPRSPFARAAEI